MAKRTKVKEMLASFPCAVFDEETHEMQNNSSEYDDEYWLNECVIPNETFAEVFATGGAASVNRGNLGSVEVLPFPPTKMKMTFRGLSKWKTDKGSEAALEGDDDRVYRMSLEEFERLLGLGLVEKEMEGTWGLCITDGTNRAVTTVLVKDSAGNDVAPSTYAYGKGDAR